MLVRANLPRLGERADRVLAVGMENDVPIAILDGRKRAHDGPQLGDVARCFADVLGDLLAVAPADEHDSDAGWPRVARARAIGEGKDRLLGRLCMEGDVLSDGVALPEWLRPGARNLRSGCPVLLLLRRAARANCGRRSLAASPAIPPPLHG